MNSVVDVMDKGKPPCVENYKDPVEPMYMFVNGMQQSGDIDQFMFIVTDDGKHDSYVYNRLVHLNIEKSGILWSVKKILLASMALWILKFPQPVVFAKKHKMLLSRVFSRRTWLMQVDFHVLNGGKDK